MRWDILGSFHSPFAWHSIFLWGKRFFDVGSACMTFCLTKYDPSAFSRFTMIFVEPVRQVIVLQVIHVAHIIIYPMENRLPIEYLCLHQLLAINDHQEEAKYVDVELMKHGCDPISQCHSWDMKIRTDLQQHWDWLMKAWGWFKQSATHKKNDD